MNMVSRYASCMKNEKKRNTDGHHDVPYENSYHQMSVAYKRRFRVSYTRHTNEAAMNHADTFVATVNPHKAPDCIARALSACRNSNEERRLKRAV